MKLFKILSFFIILCSSLLQAKAYDVTQQQALDAVAAYRQLTTDPGRYYVATVDTVLNDGFHCIIDTVPQISWLNNSSPMWMVFVDEQPTNHLWSHPCNYYYVLKVAASLNDIPVVGFVGRWKHTGLGLVAIIDNNQSNYPSQPASIVEPSINTQVVPVMAIPSKLHVVMLVGGSEPDNNYMSFYRDAKYFYRVLTQRHDIPKLNIHVLMGSGGQEENDAKDYIYYENAGWEEEFVTMPTDLDDDGFSDIAGSTEYCVMDSVFNRLAQRLDSTEHLLLLVDMHGDYNPSRLSLWGMDFYNNYQGLLSTELHSYLNSIETATQCIILGNCYAGPFAQELKGNGRVILAASSNTEGHGDGVFFYFLHNLTNALNEIDCNSQVINSDLTNDDVISMEEAYVYASNYDHYEHHSVPYVDRVETLYYSLPNHFGYDWSLSYQPSPAELFVRDDESDNGKEATEWYWSSEWRPWESPDIWVRNSNDGLTNQESEPLIVTSTDKTVYVYVRLTNRGFKPYPGHGRYLHLHWARPSLNHSSGSWQPSFPGNPLAPELAILPITATIDTIQSTIVSYAWTVPQALVNEAVNDYSGHLWVDLLARVSDSSRKTMYDNSGLLLPYHYTDMTSVLQSRALAQRSVYANVSNESISVPVTIQNLGSESRTFRIEPQSFPSNTPPACLNLSVTLPVALARIVHGDTTITQPETVSFSTIGPFTLPAQSSYTLMLNGTVNTALAQSNSVFSKALDLYSGNKLVGGATLVMTTGSRGIPLAPSIEGGEEGCEDELGDNGNGIVSTRLLRMTGVDEPVSCRWSDATGTLLSTSDSLAISRQASGTYILTVTALSDGAKASVSKDLSPAPSIKSAVVNGDILTLTLFHAAPAGMKVMVQPTLEAHSPIQTVIPLGETQCAVSLSQLSQGPCVVSLWQGGLMLESVQVMR